MALIAPSGPVYQAGTLSGNPIAMAAGLATLRELQTHGTYEQLAAAGEAMAAAVRRAGAASGIGVQAGALGGMWGFFLTDHSVTDYSTARTADTTMYGRLFHALLGSGVYLAPSQFEAAFVSTAHDAETLGRAQAAIESVIPQLA